MAERVHAHCRREIGRHAGGGARVNQGDIRNQGFTDNGNFDLAGGIGDDGKLGYVRG